MTPSTIFASAVAALQTLAALQAQGILTAAQFTTAVNTRKTRWAAWQTQAAQLGQFQAALDLSEAADLAAAIANDHATPPVRAAFLAAAAAQITGGIPPAAPAAAPPTK